MTGSDFFGANSGFDSRKYPSGSATLICRVCTMDNGHCIMHDSHDKSLINKNLSDRAFNKERDWQKEREKGKEREKERERAKSRHVDRERNKNKERGKIHRKRKKKTGEKDRKARKNVGE